jgi:heteromeric Ino2p/Ino4p transcription factor
MSSTLKEKPRLTEQEKKNNHIASEQKRRQAIRDGFDRLANIVPGMTGQGRSENLVLQSTLDYMKKQLDEYNAMMAEAQLRNIDTRDVKIEGVDQQQILHVQPGHSGQNEQNIGG